MRLLSDVNFDGRVLRGLLQQLPELDMVRAQEVGLDGADDELVLDFAADDDRVILTHDRRTMITPARDRFLAGLSMPGLIIVGRTSTLRLAIEHLAIVVYCSLPDDWPLRVCEIP